MTEEDPKPGISLSERIAHAAAGIGEGIVRTTQSAASLIVDVDLRRRGKDVLTRNIQHGIQSGATSIKSGIISVQQGPRYLQSVLTKLSHEIEEQRLRILLDEQRDMAVDVQIGFQLYEDAPQELRSRLWMVLLHHPEVVEKFRQESSTPDGYTNDSHDGEQTEQQRDVHTKQEQYTERLHHHHDHTETSPDHHHHHTTTTTHSSGSSIVDDTPPGPSDWEVVSNRGSKKWLQGSRLLKGKSLHRIEPWSSARESFRQEIMAAMTALPWPIPTEHSPDGRYSTLVQISIGQEDIDDVIQRDVHRTFPEFPLFAAHQGQQALFRVLKAYSLHDLEVGYCQGMAFVAGLLLFYLPEEPAFMLFCKLFSESGANLRTYYLPGLRGLKIQLRKFDWLLRKHLPHLKSHLEAHGAVVVLFAAQWFLSVFSNPFPVFFSSRLLDIMLIEDSDAALMRTALAVMAEGEAELMMQEDFEELLTYLKVEPMSWSHQRLRGVLNAALNSPITDQELELAEEEAMNADEPLLGGLPLESLAIVQEKNDHGDNNDNTMDAVHGNKSSVVAVDAPTSADAVEKDADGEDTGGEMAQQELDLDSAYLELVMDLDRAWTASVDHENLQRHLSDAGQLRPSPFASTTQSPRCNASGDG